MTKTICILIISLFAAFSFISCRTTEKNSDNWPNTAIQDDINDLLEDEPNDLPNKEISAKSDCPYTTDQGNQTDYDLSKADSYDLTGIINNFVRETLITENGFLAAYNSSDPEQVILYDLNSEQLIVSVELGSEAEDYYCLRIDETAGGVNFTFNNGRWPVKDSAYKTLAIDWKGNSVWQKQGSFCLPFADGEVAEWEGGIVYIDGKNGEKKVLATYNYDGIAEFDSAYAWLKLFKILDENSFIYSAKYDVGSMGTYLYDVRTEKSTKFGEYTGYPLGIGGNYLLCAFGFYGTDGMILADLSNMETITKIENDFNGGASRASISNDGAIVMAAVYATGNNKGFIFFDAQTSQLMENYQFSFQGVILNTYGFWQRRPYFFHEGNGKTTLFILPEWR